MTVAKIDLGNVSNLRRQTMLFMNTKKMNLLDLPDEIFINILQYLEPLSLLCIVSLVSKRFFDLSSDKTLWCLYLDLSRIPDDQKHLEPYKLFQKKCGLTGEGSYLHIRCLWYLKITKILNGSQSISHKIDTLTRIAQDSTNPVTEILFNPSIWDLLIQKLEEKGTLLMVKQVITCSEIKATDFFKNQILLNRIIGIAHVPEQETRTLKSKFFQKTKQIHLLQPIQQVQENIDWLLDLVITFPSLVPEFLKSPYVFYILNPHLYPKAMHECFRKKFTQIKNFHAFYFVLNKNYTPLLEAYDNPNQFFSL